MKAPKIGLNGLFKRFLSVFLIQKSKMGSKNTCLYHFLKKKDISPVQKWVDCKHRNIPATMDRIIILSKIILILVELAKSCTCTKFQGITMSLKCN
jgi:hypothetical protein